ncbi:MAG: hypothetical protein ACK45R_09545 [Candidatus Kapaibacterium sp.]
MRTHRLITLVAVIILSLAEFVYCHATEWRVGPGRNYTKPSSLAALVNDGDTISIDAATYTADVCRWTAHHLLFRGVGGNAVLASQGNVYGGKAIWVITGDSAVIENITFKDARCVDRNGAGIRLEGHHMVVRSCVFEANEDGILVGAIRPCTILIEYSEFSNSGFGDGLSHNLYIGAIDTLIFRYNYSHHCKVGHEFKSRADVNYVMYNRIATEATGTGSRLMDIPNGGYAVIVGNDLMQGPLTSNSNMIGYGLEGLRSGISHKLFVAHNTFVSTRSIALFTSYKESTELVGLWNNLVLGKGTFAPVVGTVPVEQSGNIIMPDVSTEVLEPLGTNFSLPASSVARDSAMWDMISLRDNVLLPVWEYVHPMNKKERCKDSRYDVGSHEFCSASDVPLASDGNIEYELHNSILSFGSVQRLVNIWNAGGALLHSCTGCSIVDLSTLPSGLLLLQTPGGLLRVMNCR